MLLLNAIRQSRVYVSPESVDLHPGCRASPANYLKVDYLQDVCLFNFLQHAYPKAFSLLKVLSRTCSITEPTYSGFLCILDHELSYHGVVAPNVAESLSPNQGL